MFAVCWRRSNASAAQTRFQNTWSQIPAGRQRPGKAPWQTVVHDSMRQWYQHRQENKEESKRKKKKEKRSKKQITGLKRKETKDEERQITKKKKLNAKRDKIHN